MKFEGINLDKFRQGKQFLGIFSNIQNEKYFLGIFRRDKFRYIQMYLEEINLDIFRYIQSIIN